MHLSLQLVLLLILGVATLAALWGLAAVWLRIKALPLAETARLVQDLERRQRELESLMARLVAVQPVSSSVVDSGGGMQSNMPTPKTSRRVDQAEADAVSGPRLIKVPNMSAIHAGSPASVSVELGRKFGAIWELADAGTSSEAIARTTGQPVGQVELILGLRRQLANVSASSNTRGRT